MSAASMWVRFPDGSIRYGIYSGTSDLAFSRLFETLDEAWVARESGDWDTGADQDEPVAVEIATNYGSGFHWRGTATVKQLHDGADPYGIMLDVRGATSGDYGRHEARTALGSGVPDWVP